MAAPRFLPAGESALVVEFGATADPSFHAQVLALDAAIAAGPIEGVVETVPTYRSLMVHFDPTRVSVDALKDMLLHATGDTTEQLRAKCWRIPACYDAPHSEDLNEAAEALAVSPERIGELHAGARYKVVMYGFAPGFVFLSGLPRELTISRRQTPRPPAPPGALTIANGQALIASIAMPTGWYVLGRTPVRTFDLSRDPPFPIGVGDEVIFARVDAAAFDALERRIEAGEYSLEPQ